MSDGRKFSHGKILEIFDHLSPIISDKVGGMVHLVRVIGPRWSYVAGYVPEELPCVSPVRVMLDDEWAVLYYPEEGRQVEPDAISRLFLEALDKNDDAE